MFYDVPVSYVKFRCELEPFNTRNANSIRLKCPKASAHLAPLLLSGFHAEGCLCCMCVGL